MGAAGKSCLLCRQISFANLFTHRLMLTKHSYEAQQHLSRDSDTHCGPAQIMIKTTLSAPIPTGQSDPGKSSIKVVFSDDSRLCRIENRNELGHYSNTITNLFFASTFKNKITYNMERHVLLLIQKRNSYFRTF